MSPSFVTRNINQLIANIFMYCCWQHHTHQYDVCNLDNLKKKSEY